MNTVRAFLSALAAVLSAFIGIRRREDAKGDLQLKLAHVVVAGVLCAALLVVLLITLVRNIVK